MNIERDAQDYFHSALRKINTDHDVKGGLDDLTQAILLSPTNIEYVRERANLLYFELERLSNTDDYDKLVQLQLADLNTIIELGTDLDDLTFARDRRASCFRELGRFQDQLADLTWLIDHKYQIPYSHRRRAACEERLGLFENALDDYSILLKAKPTDAHALQGRATTYYHLQRYQAALDDLKTLFSIRHGSSSDYSNRARCYYRLGRLDEVREDFIKSTELAGGTPLDISAADYMRILWSED